MRLVARLPVLMLAGALTAHPSDAQADRARAEAVIRRAIDAIGGEDRWRAVRTIELAGRGLQNHVGDSEWPNGPFFVDYRAVVEWRDLGGNRRATRSVVTSALDTSSYVVRALGTLSRTVQLTGDSGAPSVSVLL